MLLDMCKLLQLLKNPRKLKLKYLPSKKHFHDMAHLFSLRLEGHLILVLFTVFKSCFTNAALKKTCVFTSARRDIWFFTSIYPSTTSQMSYTCLSNLQEQRGRRKPDLLFLAKGLDLHKLLSVGAPAPCYSQATPSLILEHQLMQLSASPWSLQRNQSHAWWLPAILL